MAQLLYKTRGETNPRGKPRVYFACHGEDFKGYFLPISEEILKISDCAIYYYEGEPEPDEDFYLNLGQMQLIVMPVTSRLLYQPNRAMDVEFPYAIEHHIPVLPLMQESGLEKRFNEKCGDLQFLDKYNSDPTAIPYAEKLKKYLEAVLVGDELAAKVRAAFDAYIFLSYRKKDRKFAQELMRLIHKSPFCRDIAIWYDEFLTPGENFNDAIRAALEKSGLFVLAVTPNLINEINYVMTVEYPMAKETGMPILPAEMQPTDPNALRESYDGIPDSVDPRQEEAMSKALAVLLRNLALRENDSDPQHNFFIGLAYLSGIDVEVDHDYAVKLITASAESGLTEAMEKLVSMYETGEGVQRNYETAISWRERLAEQARLRYEETDEEQDGYAYIGKLWDLGDAQRAMNHLAPAKATFEEMRVTAEKLTMKYSGSRGPRCISVSYNKLGVIAEKENDLHAAKEWFMQSLEIARKLAENGAPKSQRELSVSYEKLGGIAEAEDDLPAAKGWYLQGLEIRQKLAKAGKPETLEDLSVSYDRLGGIAEAENDLSAAKEWYLQSLDIRRKLAESGVLKSQRALSICHYYLGRIAEKSGDLAMAKEWYLQCLEMFRKLAESGTPESQRDLSYSYNKLGGIAEIEGDLSAAKEWYLQAMEIDRKLAKSGTPESQRDLSVSYNNLGVMAEEEGDLATAKEWYLQGLEIRRKLAESGTPESRRDLSTSYNMLGGIAEKEGDLATAKEWYLQGLEIDQKLAESGTPLSQRNLSVCYEGMGLIAEKEGNLPLAKEWYLRGLEIRRKLAESGTLESLRDLSVTYNYLGIVAEAEGDLAAAKEWYLQELEINRKLAESGAPEFQRDLSFSYSRLGGIAKKENDLAAAKEWYLRSLEIDRKLAESTHTVSSYNDLAFSYNQLGTLDSDVELLEKALDIYLRLAKTCPDVPKYSKNAEAVKKALQSLQKRDEPPQKTNKKTESIWKRIFRRKKDNNV